MFFEILLLSVVVATGYLGPALLRRLPPGRRSYAWMLLADLLLALVAFAGQRSEPAVDGSELLGVVAIGGGICLVMVPPVLRDLARRAVLGEHLRIALFLIDARELLQPHMGARQERELVGAILAVRSGQVEAAIDVLREARSNMSNQAARRRIDERIIMTYLYARSWDQAVGEFEKHMGDPRDCSAQLVVEMVRAYCEAGRLDEAATLIEYIEESPMAGEAMFAFLLNRARMVFLAFVGRTGAVEAIVAAKGPMNILPDAARQFWCGVARRSAGDRSGARSSFERAAKLSGRDRRARDLAQETLRSLDTPGALGPHPVAPHVAALADRLTALAAEAGPSAAAKRTPALSGVSWRRVPVTSALIAVNVLVALVMAWQFGSTSDVGGLVRAGANVKSAVAAGQWWRLPASMFLHVGVLHIVLNMFGLWVLGKLLEQMYGPVRYFAVYMLAGIAGALASFYFGPPGMSAGASGAVFGVLGAAAAELALHRKAYPEQWRRALFGNLVFLIVANGLIGAMYPAIDQSAHMGGLVAGALSAAVVSRQSSYARAPIVRVVALMVAILGGGAIAYAGFGVATNGFSDTMAGYPRVRRELGGLSMLVPSHWERVSADGRDELIDPAPYVALWAKRIPVPPSLRVANSAGAPGVAIDVDAQLDELLRVAEAGDGNARDFDSVRRPIARVAQVPPPWRSRELLISVDGDGWTQHYRVIIFGRSSGDELWLGRIMLPATLASDAGELLGGILSSVEVGRSPPAGAAHESL